MMHGPILLTKLSNMSLLQTLKVWVMSWRHGMHPFPLYIIHLYSTALLICYTYRFVTNLPLGTSIIIL